MFTRKKNQNIGPCFTLPQGARGHFVGRIKGCREGFLVGQRWYEREQRERYSWRVPQKIASKVAREMIRHHPAAAQRHQLEGLQ